jgi:hypothetical protein
MALHISHELARLIRERAYAAGTLAKAEDEIARFQQQLREAERLRDVAKAELMRQNALLARYPTIKVHSIRAIRPQPRRLKIAHGAFTKEMVRYLREAKRPVGTGELRDYLFAVFEIERGSTAEEREWQRTKVCKRLREMVKRNVVLRVNARSLGRGRHGLWLWTGD